jgi:DNA-binding CsgD family transcriptional regulator
MTVTISCCDLSDFLDAYNYARHLKTLSGLTPYEYICKIWTSELDRFILNLIHQMLGLNTWKIQKEKAATRPFGDQPVVLH